MDNDQKDIPTFKQVMISSKVLFITVKVIVKVIVHGKLFTPVFQIIV
ncbi:MAG: hypothetical protein AB7I49_03825 [Candidatus Nitrosocosmicus sp.]